MDEQFEVFDEDGNLLGIESRAVVHRKGLWHRASNIFLFLPNGDLLIQRRQLSKDVWPGAWDVSAAENLLPGETFEQGAIRGLREELGVVVSKLDRFGIVTKSRLEVEATAIRDYEFQQSFRTIYDGPISPDASEVSETRAVNLRELEAAFIKEPDMYTPWFRRRADELGLFRLPSSEWHTPL
ncbi:MAG: NUDIX domain-containing protein [Gammaproteobacteria bacterium]